MAEKNNKKEKEEMFDFLTPYLERVGLEEKKEKKESEEKHHLDISAGEIVKDVVELVKKERKITVIVAIEIILTFILILMLVGMLPFF